ncbi:hypothetical protein FLK61_34665 [Paenalkalicoccus suaedae]|uniref:Uncharacterized protein n=1 Tax=Paenalkalicoccus suaedae TaxID=2592382 RepID=A0A859FGM7_9BACI|nr:hypothetical protein [Paenalkalicoccus suaedae]QKS71814.1 hypothetical protein FLK61_34665 [Paenalkalicoccus suaedae]
MKIHASYLWILLLLIMTACSNDSSDGVSQQEEDMASLIATNDRLTESLERELKEKEALLIEMKEVEEENQLLKDNILTYKQQAIELEASFESEMAQKARLDRQTLSFLKAMHEEDHLALETLTQDHFEIDREKNILTFEESEGLTQSFHFLQMHPTYMVQQRLATLEEGEYTVEYEFYLTDEDSFDLTSTVEIKLAQSDEDTWAVSSVRYTR